VSSHNPSRAKKDNTALRIVTQYRDKSSMVYELRCGDAELNLRISAHQTDDDEEQWQIEARTSRADGAACLAGSASTRREALLEISRKWALGEATNDFPSFDWEAVARVLTAVRALELEAQDYSNP